MNLLLLGAGYSAVRIACRLRDQCASVTGTTRSADRFQALRDLNIEPVLFSGEKPSAELERAVRDATHVVMSIAPGNDTSSIDPFIDYLQQSVFAELFYSNLQWCGYLSTVGVYGDHQGEWVTEDTVCKPVSSRSVKRLAAERAWQLSAAGADVPLAIFRLAGIYGPGRNALKNLERGTARRMIKPGQVFNRIHVDDIAAAVSAAIAGCCQGIYNITDDLPAPPQDVVSYAARLLQREPPEEISFATADLSPMARSFYSENKRVSNTTSKSLPGMSYRFPDYKIGLRALWESGNW